MIQEYETISQLGQLKEKDVSDMALVKATEELKEAVKSMDEFVPMWKSHFPVAEESPVDTPKKQLVINIPLWAAFAMGHSGYQGNTMTVVEKFSSFYWKDKSLLVIITGKPDQRERLKLIEAWKASSEYYGFDIEWDVLKHEGIK